MEIPRHWRMREHRLSLKGFSRINPENGAKEVSINGSTWWPLNNGHTSSENPLLLPEINPLDITIGNNGNGKNGKNAQELAVETPVVVYSAKV